MKQLLALLLFVPGLCLAQNEGCTYVDADNYDPDALNDDGSCTFQGGTYHLPTTISTSLFDPCGNDGLLRDEPAYSTSWTTEQYKEALTQHIEDEGYGKVLILSMEHAIVNPEFDGYGLDWTSNQTIGNEWNVSCAYSAYLTEWIPSITVAFTDPCILAACAGCMDSTALNFSNQANEDDGSCIFADELCGEGTVWDDSTSTCIVAYPTDVDLDGCTGVGDVLGVLANFGGCYPSDPYTWTCGDPLTYWDYNYATILIGNECWFAENLRTSVYENGDLIPAGLNDGDWTTTTSGATTVYGYGSSSCGHYSPDIDACDDVQSFAVYGRLYNWYAVNDARDLCPESWHVSTDGEWTGLEDYITSQGFAAGMEGIALKSTYGWSEQLGGGNGTDDFGFSALPGGYRGSGGTFVNAGYGGNWWSSSPNGGNAWYWYLYSPDLNRNYTNPRHGYAVRCIKD